MSGFVHLHVHSEYSLLDGACRIKKLIDRAKALGQDAVAVTDHGCMYGTIDFYRAAKSKGIKPIIGCEVYVAPRSRHDKVHRLDTSPYHLVLLCENLQGYHNLIRLVSLGYVEGFYNKPRVDLELLERYHEGLICLSACLAGEVARKLANRDYAGAKETALRYQAIFGKGNYYLEMQNHRLPEQIAILPQLAQLAKETDIPLVATNDAHYLERADAEMQHVLLCIQLNKTIDEPNAMGFATDEFYLKSEAEMAELFPNFPEAIANTGRIAERCNVEFSFGQIKLPKFEINDGSDTTTYFRALCQEGMNRRYGANPSDEVRQRMAYELGVIEKMGYVDYFLIVWDFIRYARDIGVPVGPGRGSGAGSICAYCIGITGIDPIRYHLLFERFLNPERVSMPDFDIDFCIEGRQSVIDYVVRRYGSERVAQIIAFDTMKAKGAIRDTGRALGLPYALCDKAAKLISNDLHATLSDALSHNKQLIELDQTDPRIHRLLSMAQRIEGMPRHASTHAAGVVIASAPVMEFVPLQKNEESIVTQYTMTNLEQLGLLKMDFLGLRNLTVIRDAVTEIRKTVPDFSVDSIPIDDKAVYDMLSRGDTQGVFQFESAGMCRVLSRLKPVCIEDLIAVISLYRPGPMESIPKYIANRHNPQNVRYAHPLLKPILEVTYGCIVYQEQVMEICRALAGYSYGRADLVRRAMAKKKHDVMEQERHTFLYGNDVENGCIGAIRNGVPEEVANAIFDEMTGFASYAFNKSHAAAYAYLAYQTAFLKCHYFRAYMAALMTSVLSSTGKLLEYIAVCEAHGVPVCKPDINISHSGFTPAGDGGIHFGLLAIRGLGKGVITEIEAERREQGRFVSFLDFCERVSGRGINKRSVESLIRCGALDQLGSNRRQMLIAYEGILDAFSSSSRQTISGQLDLFGAAEEPTSFHMAMPDAEEFPEQELLRMEKEMTGLYLSGHPLSALAWCADLMRLPNLQSVQTMAEEQTVSVLCMLQEIKPHTARNGGKMCFLTLEDLGATLEGVIFPKDYQQYAPLLEKDRVFWLSGRVSVKDGERSLLCSAVLTQEDFLAKAQKRRLCIKVSGTDRALVESVLAACNREPGDTAFCLYLTAAKKYLTPRTPGGVRLCKALYQALTALVAAENLGLLEAL